MSRRFRTGLFLVGGAGLSALLGWGFAGLPAFGDYHGVYGRLLNRDSLGQTHAMSAIAAVTFDYRGFDTLGEEFILFTAVTGVVLLLREGEVADQAAELSRPMRVPGVRLFGVLMVGAALLVGAWLAAFGYVTPGGGFQGGVVVAGAILLVFLAAGYRPWVRLANEKALDPMEGLGVGTFVCVGLAALIASEPFLHNLFGPGRSGTLVSGGSMPLLNWATALEVAATVSRPKRVP